MNLNSLHFKGCKKNVLFTIFRHFIIFIPVRYLHDRYVYFMDFMIDISILWMKSIKVTEVKKLFQITTQIVSRDAGI